MNRTTENNKRIAKNVLLLYFRMMFMMIVSLYTSRVVLNTLGVEDFGIYNVVGGVVAMFGFLNSAMSSSTQRYITFELGRNNSEQLKNVFNTSLSIHTLIAIIIFILAETIGLWFFYHKMTIPADRMEAALWVYQGAIASTIVLIMSVPYNATIIAHEKMSAFAYISVLEVILKLLIVYLLLIVSFDKLKLYAVLMFCIQLIIRCIYGNYCKKHFPETKIQRVKDWKLFREMLGFAGWNLWGYCASIAFSQGINILLNIFFGPIINAARGVAVQVQNAVNQFSFNFQTALNPQITKSYAMGNLSYMHSLIFRSSKLTFLLLLVLSLPIQLEAETILGIWLKNVPDHTANFLRIILCVTIIDATANPLMISASATGKVKFYQSVIGGTLLMILPVSYMVLKFGGNPESVFIVHLTICIIAFTIRLFIIKPMIQLSLGQYFKEVILKCAVVTVISLTLSITVKYFMDDSFGNFLVLCIISVSSVILSAYYLGLNKEEKLFINQKIIGFVNKIKG